MKKKTIVSECLAKAYGELAGFDIIRTTAEDPDRRFWVHYTCGNLDFLIENDTHRLLLLVGRRPNVPRRMGEPGCQAGMYYFEDVASVLGDPSIPSVSALEFADIAEMLPALQPRLESIFADRSEASLKRALNNRIATRT